MKHLILDDKTDGEDDSQKETRRTSEISPEKLKKEEEKEIVTKEEIQMATNNLKSGKVPCSRLN